MVHGPGRVEEAEMEPYVTRVLRTMIETDEYIRDSEYEGTSGSDDETLCTVSMCELGHFPPYAIGGKGHVYTQEQIGMIRQLWERGWTISTGPMDRYCNTPLHIAHCHGNQLMIDFLLETGADPLATNYQGKKPQDMGRSVLH
jgi:hypothetical protein